MKALKILFFSSTILVLSSCATVFGGRKYNAIVSIDNNPEASIYYKGSKLGEGNATVKIPRAHANKLAFKVRKEGCPEQEFVFSSRKTRGWALTASIISDILLFPAVVNNIVDISTGAYYKPNEGMPNIRKVDNNNYNYNLDYTKCKTEVEKRTLPKTKKEKLEEIESLYKEGVISKEEYEESRKTILAN